MGKFVPDISKISVLIDSDQALFNRVGFAKGKVGITDMILRFIIALHLSL